MVILKHFQHVASFYDCNSLTVKTLLFLVIGLKRGYENEVINLGVLFHKDADAYPSDVLSAVLAPKGRLERAHPTDGRTNERAWRGG